MRNSANSLRRWSVVGFVKLFDNPTAIRILEFSALTFSVSTASHGLAQATAMSTWVACVKRSLNLCNSRFPSIKVIYYSSLGFLCHFHSLSWAKEPITVIVDHVVWGVTQPDLGFPSDGLHVLAELGEIWESANVYRTGSTVL